ncbi:molybdopterin cofactor-binding domain-containing protein, partial [Burkholderia sp.]
MHNDHAPDTPGLDDTPRRRFLKQSSALLAAGIAIGFRMPDAMAAGKNVGGDPHPSAGEFEPNAWVRVLPDDTIKLVVHKHDSGTGTRTALAAVVAEELDVDPFRVDVITPEDPFFADYIHPLWKVFSTGGSTSVAMEYDRLRRAGATARAMLVEAAAQQWSVPVSACTTADGAVSHAASGRRATYGSLAQAAAQLPAPKDVALKDPAQFRYIGKLRKKRGAAQKADGSFPYSIDVSLPGMRVAVVTRAPMIDGRVRSVDAKAALAIPGVREVLQIPPRPDVLGGNQAGVAVLADDYWSAHRGQAALTIEWEDSLFATFDSSTLAARQAAWVDDPAARVVPTIADGDPAKAKAAGTRTVEASYSMPHKAANPLEPINITVWARNGGIEYWGGLQVPSTAMEAADVIGGIPAHRVTLHELVSGGSFGARESKYWLFEATWLAVKTGKPVKLMNSREDEMRALFYHAASYHRARAVLDARGNLASLWLRGVMPASPQQWEPGYLERT